MKTKSASEPATKEDINKLEKNTKVNLSALKIRVDIKMENLENRMDEKARLYRDEILTKLDAIMGELVNAREERIFMNHDIQDHEKRINALEKAHHAS